MGKPSFTYSGKEKLKSRLLLKHLFANGKSLNTFPVKLFYAQVDSKDGSTLKTGVGVSSRHFKHAVDRNRIKRLIRESYRIRKHKLGGLQLDQHLLVIFILFTGKELPSLQQIDEPLDKLLDKLVLTLQQPKSYE